MFTLSPSARVIRRESADALLAKNLVTARLTQGVTQHELAQDSGISRATIAQIETGSSDPRLSTIAELARALGLPTIFLLIGLQEVAALAEVLHQSAMDRPSVDPRLVGRMGHFVNTGMLKDRIRAALIGAKSVESFSENELTRVSAAIFSAFLPGAGTEIGAILGELLAQGCTGSGRVEAQSLLAKDMRP
jgi:transcriptional regulator with XRE-family HTH domain